MLKFLSKLLGHSKLDSSMIEPKNAVCVPDTQAQRQLTPIVPDKTRDALDFLWSKVAHLSNPNYRFLHLTYSPGSRVPCAAFTPFISKFSSSIPILCSTKPSSLWG